jgi:hypothetical protein
MSAGTYQPSTGPGLELPRMHSAALRLVYLHMASRRVPEAVASMAAFALVLCAALHWHWGTEPEQAPIIIEGAAAVVIAYAVHSPFGESEKPTGRWLPYLRLAVTLVLTAAAIGAFAAGAAAVGHLPDGTLALARNVLGLVGVSLLAAVVLGGTLFWAGTLIYLALSEYAISEGWATPWIWATRPPHDLGGALCAGAVTLVGILLITMRGPRDSAQEE